MFGLFHPKFILITSVKCWIISERNYKYARAHAACFLESEWKMNLPSVLDLEKRPNGWEIRPLSGKV